MKRTALAACIALAGLATACQPAPQRCTPVPDSDAYDHSNGIVYRSQVSDERLGYQLVDGGPIYADPACFFPR